MDKIQNEALSRLYKEITLFVEKYKKNQNEIVYMIERLKNLNAVVNASDTDVPKELIKNWIMETIEELEKMENIDPKKIEGKNKYGIKIS